MRVTFLAHDGFFIELDTLCLLFDWWKEPVPSLPDKPLLVFVSHRHEDHFNRRCGKHDVWEPLPGVTVETFPSTDEGVAWMVTAEGRTIFHAGDLNWWHWAEEDDAWNRNMAANFKRYTEPLRGRRADLAMLPLDPRLGKDGYLGPEYFLELMDVRHFLPMHQWDDFAFTDQFLAAYPQFAPITTKIHHNVEVFTFWRC